MSQKDIPTRIAQVSREHYDPFVPEENTAGRLAIAKLSRAIDFMERMKVGVEPNSVYGAAVLMPQLARTSGWNRQFTSLVISSYVYLFFCILLHGWMLTFMSKEENVMDLYGGQMYLCDFGENIQYCQGDDCKGPGGTKITAPRLYNWQLWNLRGFVRDTLVGLFPERADEIAQIADPGEYGVESYTCRLLCVIMFVMSMIPEIWLCIDMVKLLWYVPTRSESWIELEGSEEEVDAAEHCIDKVRVKVAGMTRPWKIINAIFVLFPKVILVYFTAEAGVCFLMETAGIDDIIVNSVALGFLLQMDELITDNLMSDAANKLLDVCEPFNLGSKEAEEALDSTSTMDVYRTNQRFYYGRMTIDIVSIQLKKFFVVAIITSLLVAQYYSTHCDLHGSRFVSKSMYAPKSTSYNILNAFLPWFYPIEQEEDPYWSMPKG